MEEKVIIINGSPANYKTFGEGKPVLILHGWGGKSDSWISVGELLAESGFKAIIPDLPGFGKSEEPKTSWTVDDYFKFAEKFTAILGLEKFHLLGHSFGGGLSLMYAARNREKVQSLTLCDSAVIRKERLSFRQAAAKKMALAKKVFVKLPFFATILPLGQKIVYKIAGVQDYRLATPVMKETFNKIIAQDLQKYAALVAIPVLIVWGEKDKTTPVEDAYTLQHLMPGSSLKIVENAAHNPHRQNPEKLVKIIVDFIKTK